MELTFQQIGAFALVIAMLALFMWDRLRYDLVALSVLLAAIAIGVVKPEHAFDGFSNPVIIIIGSVLIVSRSISSSGLLDGLMRRALRSINSPSVQIAILTACVAFLSAIVKNVGTLAIFMPIAIQVARRSGQSPSIYLMPLAFGSLIGGTITQIGTSPNLLISTVRENQGMPGFTLFDFAWVGLPMTLIAIAYLSVAWRLLPRDRKGSDGQASTFEIEKYTTEMQLVKASPLVGKRVGDLEHFGDSDILVRAVTRGQDHHYIPHRNWQLRADDVVTIQADSAAIKLLTDEGNLKLIGAEELEREDEGHDELATIEAIVSADSLLVGQTPESLNLRYHYDVNLLAVSRAGYNRHTRLREHRFDVGDIIALQGWQKELPQTLSELGCLPLADRGIGLGLSRRGLVPLAILLVAMVLVALKLVDVTVGFFAAAVLVILLRQLTLKEAYSALDGPVIVMLAALIPVGEGFKETGAAEVVGNLLGQIGSQAPPYLALAMMLAASMILTPFLHHAAAVLVLGPVAAVLATSLGYHPDPFLMAVALGCGCDFLTPIGHQNNLLVMGPGGYKFRDFWRLGLPLSILVVVAGTALIMWAWPLQ
ncbi:MAG: SLC13 family permease [Hyphomicrobiaceae bacterium]